jgi:hypothetical protein
LGHSHRAFQPAARHLRPGFPECLPLLGSSTRNLETPNQWTQGHEFGGRIQGLVEGSLISINGFYGRENNPLLLIAAPSTLEMNAAPGINLLHPDPKGYYP